MEESEIDSLRHENYMLKKEIANGVKYFDNLIEEYEKSHNLFVEITVSYSGFGYEIYHRNPNRFCLDYVYDTIDFTFPTRELAKIDCLKFLQNNDLKCYEKSNF